MKQLITFPEPRLDRYASALAHDEPNCRVIFFTLAAGQEVPVHTSASSVVVTVVSGAGEFSGQDVSAALDAGDSLSYAPNEPHGMTAGKTGLRFVAVISPNPACVGTSNR